VNRGDLAVSHVAIEIADRPSVVNGHESCCEWGRVSGEGDYWASRQNSLRIRAASRS
jgi:hypothetical protein